MSTSHAGCLSSSGTGSVFQTVGPAAGKARRPYVLSRQRGTMSRCRLAELSRCRDATSMAGVTWSARYRGACPCKQRYVMKPSLNVTLSERDPLWEWKFRDHSLRRFDTIHQCDIQTCTQTDALVIAKIGHLHTNKLCWRSVKAGRHRSAISNSQSTRCNKLIVNCNNEAPNY